MATGDSEGTVKIWLLDQALGGNYMVDSLLLLTKKDAHVGGTLAIDFSPKHSVDCSGKINARLIKA